MTSTKRRGNRRQENMPSPSREFLKRWDASLPRSICPSVTHLIWNGIACLLGNQIFLTTRTQPNGNSIWLFLVKVLFATRMAERKSALTTRSSSALTNRIDRKEHTSELQSLTNLVCRLLLEKKKTKKKQNIQTHTNTRKHIDHYKYLI